MEKHFAFVTHLEIANLYRESSAITRGCRVTADSFFVAATECRFFIKCIKIRTLFD